MIDRRFPLPSVAAFTVLALTALAIESCSSGGSQSSSLTPITATAAPATSTPGTSPVASQGSGEAPLTLNVLVPSASQAAEAAEARRADAAAVVAPKGLAVTVYQGLQAPVMPSLVADISGDAASKCRANADGSHLCSLTLTAPTGIVNLLISTYSQVPSGGKVRGTLLTPGQLNGQTVESSGRNAIGIALAGKTASVVFSPAAIPAAADGSAHTYLTFLNARDASGNYIVDGASLPTPAVVVGSDPIHTIGIVPPSQGALLSQYTIRYNGGTLNDAKLEATVPGVDAPAIADITPLNVAPNPLTVAVSPGSPSTITASMALFTGPYQAVSSDPQTCAVTAANGGMPKTPGGVAQFTVTGLQTGTCRIQIQAAGATQLVAATSGTVPNRFSGLIGSHIKHIVFIIQENRSFDNIFGGFKNKRPFPGADTWSNPIGTYSSLPPKDSNGNPVTMVQGTLAACYSPLHDHGTQLQAINGGAMNGFNLDIPQAFVCPVSTAPPAPPNYSYQYLNETEVDPYWQMAEQYALADHAFEEISSASFGSHQYLIAAQSGNTIDNPSARPWGCDSPAGTTIGIYQDSTGYILPGGPFPCFSYRSMADNFDAAGLDWRYYAALSADFGYQWAAYDAISQIRLNNAIWDSHIIEPTAQVITDVQGSGGSPPYLAPMTYVTPSLKTSDHGRGGSLLGPPYVASVINAIGQSQFWDSTAIFVMWDDYGGFYDHVPPPAKPVSGPGYGLRVPVIVISPYAKNHYVSHNLHSWGGMLKFTEEAFNLPSLGGADAQDGDDYTDMFDFTKATPAPFTVLPTANARMRDIIKAANDPGPPPDDDL
jgi:phospholipase C